MATRSALDAILFPTPQYRLCWRCGGRTSTGPKPRLCRDCSLIVRAERAIWTR